MLLNSPIKKYFKIPVVKDDDLKSIEIRKISVTNENTRDYKVYFKNFSNQEEYDIFKQEQIKKEQIKKEIDISFLSIDPEIFYMKLEGHPIEELNKLYYSMRHHNERLIFLAGDPNLDNKPLCFFPENFYTSNNSLREPPNSYRPVMPNIKCCVQDVAYHINKILEDKCKKGSQDYSWACINTSAGSALESRNDDESNLREQDLFIQKHICDGDVLIVSDEAKQLFSPDEQSKSKVVNDYINEYKTKLTSYLNALRNDKNVTILVCSIYDPYSDTEISSESAIVKMAKNIKSIKIDNCKVIHVELSKLVDYKRVIGISITVGRLMANHFVDLLEPKILQQ